MYHYYNPTVWEINPKDLGNILSNVPACKSTFGPEFEKKEKEKKNWQVDADYL